MQIVSLDRVQALRFLYQFRFVAQVDTSNYLTKIPKVLKIQGIIAMTVEA